MSNKYGHEYQLHFDPTQDLWLDTNGSCFVKNTFDPNNPIMIDVTDNLWRFCNKGTSFIDWNEINLPASIKDEIKDVIRKKLKKCSVSYLSMCRLLLLELMHLNISHYNSLLNINLSDLSELFQKISPAYKSYFREIYAYLSKSSGSSSAYLKLNKLKKIKNRRSSIENINDVLKWDPLKGALTREEESKLLDALKGFECKTSKDHAIKIACWLLMETAKRGKQIREMKKECFKKVECKGYFEYFVEIKPVKSQTGKSTSWWPIPEELYFEMISFSSRDDVRRLQEKYDHFIVFDSIELIREKVISEASFNGAIQRFVKSKLKLKSTRTDQLLHVTPLRLRHTVATRLAFKGASRDIIAELLEHDDPSSCQAYIDAIGSELCPSIEGADRNMGSLFMQLKDVYFNGEIIDELRYQPIVLPEFVENSPIPLFVGSCSRDTCREGVCTKHPFFSCYNGCPSFLVWREADHLKALNYAEKELERWSTANANQEHSTIINEFELLKENVLTVIRRIESSKEVPND